MFTTRRPMLLILALTAAFAGGCVRRTITITSAPPGALVWLNDREVGRTPVDVDFLYYGTYDVRLALEGHEPLSTEGEAAAPWWDLPGPDLVAEILPVDLHERVVWSYQLEPVADDPEGLLERAEVLRQQVPAAPAGDAADVDPDGMDGSAPVPDPSG